MREQPKCITCRFYDSVDDANGMCKVDSPKANREGDGCWPMVYTYDWCGHHRGFFKVVNTPMGAMMKQVEEGEE